MFILSFKESPSLQNCRAKLLQTHVTVVHVFLEGWKEVVEAHSEVCCALNEFVIWESRLPLSNFASQWAELLLSAVRRRYRTFHTVLAEDNRNKFMMFPLFYWMWLKGNFLFWRLEIREMGSPELCIGWWWKKPNLYNEKMRPSFSSTDAHYLLCLHSYRNLFEVRRNRSSTATIPLIHKVHLSLTHKLQSRVRALWCLSKTCNYKWKCFMIFMCCCCGNKAQPRQTVKSSNTLSHALQQKWCSCMMRCKTSALPWRNKIVFRCKTVFLWLCDVNQNCFHFSLLWCFLQHRKTSLYVQILNSVYC